MSKENTYRVGWVKDAHGLKGEIYVQLFAKQADWLNHLKVFYLEIESELREFNVERAKPHKIGLIIKPREINDRTQAEACKGAPCHIPQEYLKAEPGDGFYLHQILGFKVLDRERSLGEITAFSTNGPQDLLVVQAEGKEILIPFVRPFLKQIDFDNRVVFMELPEGLQED